MAKVFNIFSTGMFSNTGTFTRAMSTTNALVDTGTTVIFPPASVSSGRYSTPIVIESSPIKGIFLHISSVSPTANGTLTITLSSGVTLATYTYATSALLYSTTYSGETPNTTSQYWQGFDLSSAVLPASSLVLSIACSNPGEVGLLGAVTNNFNRYIIPTTTVKGISSFATPTVCVGSYVQTIDNGGSIIPAVFEYDNIPYGINGLYILNGSTLNVTTSSCILSSGQHITACPGSTLNVLPGTIIQLNNSTIHGMNSSVINIRGSYKTGFTFLTTTATIGNTAFNTTSPTVNWDAGNKILLPPVSGSTTSVDILSVRNTNNTSLTTTNACTFIHAGVTTAPYTFTLSGSPVINLTRNTIIKTVPGATGVIRAEKNCQFNIESAALYDLGITSPSNMRDAAAIALYNNASTVKNCVLTGCSVGVYIHATSAISATLTDNSIYKSTWPGVLVLAETTTVYPSSISLTSCNIIDNAFIMCKSGIAANNTRYVSITGNTINSSLVDGIVINSSSTAFQPIGAGTITLPNTLYNTTANTMYNNASCGINLVNTAGSIDQNMCVSNKLTGVYIKGDILNTPIQITNHISSYNGAAGVQLDAYTSTTGTSATIQSLTATNNGYNGIILKGIYGTVSLSVISSNKTGITGVGIDVIDCYAKDLTFKSLNVVDNLSAFRFKYPSNYNSNYNNVSIYNSTVGGSSDSTCIILDQTCHERFTGGNSTFTSSAANITLIPSVSALIEGSYVFSNCTFNTTMVSSVSTNYQTDALNDAGFVSMYHNNSTTDHRKFLAAGTILSDTVTFYSITSPISEKLIPNSNNTRLRSSKKAILIKTSPDTPIAVVVKVKVKKTNWGSNFNPRLILAAAPAFGIIDDTVLQEHTDSSTDWIELSNIAAPIFIANNIQGILEVYVDCLGISGGSINIDAWEQILT